MIDNKKADEINDRIDRRLDYLTLLTFILAPISITLFLAISKSILIK